MPAPGHKVYPYLLRGLTIDRPNQVWCSDITYVPLRCGYLYLVAVMDWFSRHVLAWRRPGGPVLGRSPVRASEKRASLPASPSPRPRPKLAFKYIQLKQA